MNRSEVFESIDVERARQDAKFPDQWRTFAKAGPLVVDVESDHHLGGDWVSTGRVAAFEMLGILTEELGEVARAIIERDDANLTVELVQVAAVVVAWLEGRP